MIKVFRVSSMMVASTSSSTTILSSMDSSNDNKLALSLSGCGFLGSYHFGAALCFRQLAQHTLLNRVHRVVGTSAGALVAAMLVLEPDKLRMGLDILYDLADELAALKYGALTPGYSFSDRLMSIVERTLPDDISSAEDRLFISVTRYRDSSNRLMSRFGSRTYLLNCLLASCFIPIYMGAGSTPPEIDAEAYVDGGLSDNLPTFVDMRTITISPFSGAAEISPSDLTILSGTIFDWSMNICNQEFKVNMQNIVRGARALFPPKRAVLEQYYTMGYRDAMNFLLNQGWLERPEGTPV